MAIIKEKISFVLLCNKDGNSFYFKIINSILISLEALFDKGLHVKDVIRRILSLEETFEAFI